MGKYQAVISEVSKIELKFAPKHAQKILSSIPKKHLEVIELTDEAKALANQYIMEKIVRTKSLADTQHIAVATVHSVDLLVSWNFKHIVNFDKIRLYNSVNLKNGYKTLEIRNPRDSTDEN